VRHKSLPLARVSARCCPRIRLRPATAGNPIASRPALRRVGQLRCGCPFGWNAITITGAS
jgi:hypothetical protein